MNKKLIPAFRTLKLSGTSILSALLLVVMSATTAQASSFDVSLSCHDSELGGGPTWRLYTCTATASGGVGPYEFEWLPYGVGFPFSGTASPNSWAFYNVDNCYGQMTAWGGVIVTDSASDMVIETTQVTLNCH